MPDLSFLAQQIAIWAIPVLLAVTVHEAAYGYAARALGDDTAQKAGRLTLNPLRHLDPVGTVALPALLVVLGLPILFGWARPVPVAARPGRRSWFDLATIAAAGPFANLLMAIAWMLMLWVYQFANEPQGGWTILRDMGIGGVSINVVLLVLNAFVPLPPFAAGRIAVLILPRSLALPLARFEPYALVIVTALVAAGAVYKLMFWPLVGVETILYQAFSVSLTDP